MRPQPLPHRRSRETQPGPARHVVAIVILYVLMELLFSGIAAIPMRLITGSWTPWTFLAGAIITAAFFGLNALSRRRKRNNALSWAAAGWMDVPPRVWPWDAAARRNHGMVHVRFAKTRLVKGFPVTVVEAFWAGGGMDGQASSFSGYGTIIVVRLPPGTARPDSSPPGTRLNGDELYVVVAERPFAAFSATGAKKPPPFRPMALSRVPEHIDFVLAVVGRLGIVPS